MIRIEYFVCKCGRLRGAENPRCREAGHAKANDQATQRRLMEDAVQRIVARFGPAAAKVYKK